MWTLRCTFPRVAVSACRVFCLSPNPPGWYTFITLKMIWAAPSCRLIASSGHCHQGIPPPHRRMARVGNLRSDLCHPVASFEPLFLTWEAWSPARALAHKASHLELLHPGNSLVQSFHLHDVDHHIVDDLQTGSLVAVVLLPHEVHHVELQVETGAHLQAGFQTWIALVDEDKDSTVDLDPVPHVDVIASLTEIDSTEPRISIRRSHSLKCLSSVNTKRILTWNLPHSQSFTEILGFLLKSLNPLRFEIWYLLNPTSSAAPKTPHSFPTATMVPEAKAVVLDPLRLFDWRWSIKKPCSIRSDLNHNHFFGLAVRRLCWSHSWRHGLPTWSVQLNLDVVELVELAAHEVVGNWLIASNLFLSSPFTCINCCTNNELKSCSNVGPSRSFDWAFLGSA